MHFSVRHKLSNFSAIMGNIHRRSFYDELRHLYNVIGDEVRHKTTAFGKVIVRFYSTLQSDDGMAG